MPRRWILKNGIAESDVQRLGRELNDLPYALSRTLLLRGISTFEEAKWFFRAGLEDTHDPFLMADMDEAATRLATAVRERERVVVYGDYDVDGTTATALLTHALRSQGVPASYFIPDRMRHGYGLSTAGIDEAAKSGASLLVALDCGVTAVDEVAYARSLGFDVIVCDHHTCPPELPDATAVLNPKRDDCNYPFSDLCGCGVTLKLVQGTLTRLGQDPADAFQYLDLVALATTSDIVAVADENRVLLREGLKTLQEASRIGISALADEAGIRLSECSTRSILFGLGPRINAAGRLGDAKRAVQLFLSETPHEAAARARQLERINRERRALDQATLADASARAASFLEERQADAIVLFDPNWHLGVVGIVASRLVDQFHKPTILLSQAGDIAKGSARSVDGINIFNAIERCSSLLEAFGGHDYAAGLSILPSRVDEFVERFLESVTEEMKGGTTEQALRVDASMTLDDVNDRFWAVLQQFEPYGPQNDPPIFHSDELIVVGRPGVVGRDGGHLKFRVRSSNSDSVDVIGFGLAHHLDTVERCMASDVPLEMVYSVTENVWNGRRSLQLRAEDVRESGHAGLESP